MKMAIVIVRVMLGLIFVVFGLNGFFLFITPPEHTATGGALINLLVATGFMYVEKSLEIIGGATLLSNNYVPLGLSILAPIVVNIFLFHLLMERYTLVVGVILLFLWGFLAWAYRRYFAGLFVRRTETKS
jgi:putative oxidoreductase